LTRFLLLHLLVSALLIPIKDAWATDHFQVLARQKSRLAELCRE
jgi:hypothetical protein